MAHMKSLILLILYPHRLTYNVLDSKTAAININVHAANLIIILLLIICNFTKDNIMFQPKLHKTPRALMYNVVLASDSKSTGKESLVTCTTNTCARHCK